MNELRYLFEVDPVDGTPLPRWPWAPDGSELPADGESLMDLGQAALRWGRTAEGLKRKWLAFFRHDLPADDAPIIDSGQGWADAAVCESMDQADGDAAAEASAPPPASRPEPGPAQVRRLQVLRKMKFAHLNDEQFDYVLNRCRALGINLESEMVFAKIIHSPHTDLPEVFVGLKMDGFRQRAHATGELARISPPRYQFSEAGQGCTPQVPDVAHVSVTRVRGGRQDKFVGEAWWDEYYADQPEGSVARRLPKASLRSRAEVAALRAAFADVLGGVYSDEELAAMAHDARIIREGHQPEGAYGDSQVAAPVVRPAYPTGGVAGGLTFDRLCLILDSMGIVGGQRVELIREMRIKHPALADRAAGIFYRKVLDEAEKDPPKWGGRADAKIDPRLLKI